MELDIEFTPIDFILLRRYPQSSTSPVPLAVTIRFIK